MKNSEYKALTIREFDKAAAGFDNSDPSVYNMCRKDYPDLLAEVKKEPFDSLLDAGCGTGAMLRLFAKDIPGKSYTGIDLSEKMIQVARANCLRAKFVQGDCEKLPFADESFDVVTCSMSFHHYPDVESFFRNVQRVLKPGGRFILRDMTSKSKIALWAFNHIEMPIINRLGKGDVHVYSREEVRQLAKKAGLQVEICEARRGLRLHAVMRKV